MNKFLRITALGALAALLATAVPAAPALAAYDEEISLDPDEGEVSEYIDVDGTDFDESGSDPEHYVYVRFYLTHEEADAGDDIDDDIEDYEIVDYSVLVDDAGEFEEISFPIPSVLGDGEDDIEVGGGTYYLCVTYKGDDRIVAVAELTVLGGEIEIDPDEGTVGSEIEINGSYFSADEELSVEFDGDDVDIEDGDEEPDGDGEFTLTILVPESTAEDHTITVYGDEGSEAEATFTVEPETTVSPTQAPPGDTVTISGTGFGNRDDVDIAFCNVDFESVTETDSSGSFSIDLEVPDVSEGIYFVIVEDESGNEADTINFTVEENFTLSVSPVTSTTAPGHIGMDVTVSGTAFKPSSQITISYPTTAQTLATTTSNASGNFTASFSIPVSEAGSHTITASDGTSSLEVPFYMESEAPDAPSPSLPGSGSEAEAQPHFDWADASDDSAPVTYTLQVATTENFTTASLVLVQDDLTSSEYTVSEANELAARGEDDPYYWRVRATDGAGNKSDWSEVRIFSVASPGWTVTILGHTLSVWAIIWWCVGCVVAGSVGYAVGRRDRRSYEED